MLGSAGNLGKAKLETGAKGDSEDAIAVVSRRARKLLAPINFSKKEAKNDYIS